MSGDASIAENLKSVWLAFFAFASRSLQQIATFVLTLLAARVLAPAEYGVYTLSVLFVTFIQTLLFSGVFHYAIRTAAVGEEEPKLTNTCFWLITGMAATGSVVLFYAAPAIARLFNAPDMTPVLQLLAVVQPLFGYTAWSSAMLMRQKRMNLHFQIMFAQNLLAFIAGIVLLYVWPSVFALVLYRMIRGISGCLLYLFFGKLLPGLQMSASIAWRALRFSLPIYGTRMMTFFANYGADLVLGVAFTTAEAGLYRFGHRLATGAADMVGHPMRSFALTQFGAANREGRKVADVVERFTSTTLVLVGCAVVSVMVFADDLLKQMFRPEYAGSLIVVYGISVHALFLLGNFLVEPVMASLGRTKVAFVYYSVVTAIQVGATLIVAAYGINALAWTLAGLALVFSVAGFWVISRYGDVPLVLIARAVWRSAVFVLAYAVLALAARQFFVGVFGEGSQALIAGIAASSVLGVLILFCAAKSRVLDLRTFSG